MWIRRAVLISLVLSCGSPQHGGPPESGHAPRVVTYGPLGLKDDAKSPHQAVILGTDAKDGSTVMWLPNNQSKATVDADVRQALAPARRPRPAA